MESNYFEQHEKFLLRQKQDAINKNIREEEVLFDSCLDPTGTEPDQVMNKADAKLLSDYVSYAGPGSGEILELSEYTGKTLFTKSDKYETIWRGRGKKIGKIVLPIYHPEVVKTRDTDLYICMDGLLRCSRNSKVFPGLSYAYKYSGAFPQVGALPDKDFLFIYHRAKNFRIITGYTDMEWDYNSSSSIAGGSHRIFVESSLREALLHYSY